ncbi:hypothetical protein CNBG_10051 [Cryptococcus deuterogattii R265]|uniref:uncharacterized protein n=1 Tax=Cryptococcus deuterogattii (strain R265) TaxID=294750 RepID=UPI0005B5D917|nr:hypothetical protein I310_03976 [Cryptococcus deuterogattii CA1014]QPK66958.1 hypothetical protein CNBG_10051 [Cryptococcus deuterogattii R265]
MSSLDPKAYNIPAKETEKVHSNHINGTQDEINARFCIQELCKGWPVYRDFSEWHNYRSLFTKEGAYVWTTWSGGLPIDKFIEVSIQGRANGDFIAHRENGTLANVDLSKGRGIGKMKATITQRFIMEGVPVDVDCDCRFIFFCKQEGKEWKAQYVKLFYEKDKAVPIDGQPLPKHLFKKEELDKYTDGYKHLAVAQNYIGHPILNDLPNANDKGFFDMYQAMEDWMQGKDIDLFWEHTE